MIHVQPCKSTAEIYDRVRAARLACYGKPKVVNIASDLRKAKEEEAKHQALIERDDFFGPLDFVRYHCEQLGTTYEAVSEPGRLEQGEIDNRRTVIRALMDKYPTMSLPKIAAIFNRDATSILFTLGNLPKRQPKVYITEARINRARQLYDQSFTMDDIAQILGVARSTIKNIKRREQWPERKKLERKARGA
jgi:hypothetical protein